MFGSKKIFAKIQNGKLIIRVGGGYMLIDEFLANYAEQEQVVPDDDEGESSPKSKFLFKSVERGFSPGGRRSMSPQGKK